MIESIRYTINFYVLFHIAWRSTTPSSTTCRIKSRNITRWYQIVNPEHSHLFIVGEESLETEKDFSRYGRVNFVLSRRLHLLDEVRRLQESLGVQGDVSYTCETAGHFYLYQIIRYGSINLSHDYSVTLIMRYSSPSSSFVKMRRIFSIFVKVTDRENHAIWAKLHHVFVVMSYPRA